MKLALSNGENLAMMNIDKKSPPPPKEKPKPKLTFPEKPAN